MHPGIKYVHTNLVARDWKKLAKFYVKVFGCKTKPPGRNLKGSWLDSLTTVKNAHAEGIHLILPGYGKDGPTLEIFQYSPRAASAVPRVNRPGYRHVAFAVDNVKMVLTKVKKYSGGSVGEMISTEIRGVGSIEVVYARDPENNIIELQKSE